jgi:hypothetical protein
MEKKNGKLRPLIALLLICSGLLSASSAFAVNEAKEAIRNKFSRCSQEGTQKLNLKGEELRVFMQACLEKPVDVSAVNREAEEASEPPPGLRGGDFSCGDAKVEFKFFKSAINEKFGVESVMTVSRGERSTILRYDMGIDFIGGTCMTNRLNKPTIVFQACCGGSGCYDGDNWGIIDPQDLRVLLVPNDSNYKDAHEILGRDLSKMEMISISYEAAKLKH